MKLKHLLIISLLLTIVSSCAIFQKAQAPKYDDDARVMTINLQTQIGNFYSNLQNDADKQYITHVAWYDIAGSAIRTLAIKDSLRKHSDGLMIIVHDAENRFHKYQKEHENYGKINNAQILAYKQGMDALLNVLVLTENHYKK